MKIVYLINKRRISNGSLLNRMLKYSSIKAEEPGEGASICRHLVNVFCFGFGWVCRPLLPAKVTAPSLLGICLIEESILIKFSELWRPEFFVSVYIFVLEIEVLICPATRVELCQ